MKGVKNSKPRTIKVFLVLLLFTAIWISLEYSFASEEYTGYYSVLNITIPRPDLANKLYKYLSDRLNVSGEFIKELQQKGYLTASISHEDTNFVIPHIKITFDSIFIDLEDIPPSKLNIFFIESTCATEEMTKRYNVTNNFMLSARQCCSIESAARNNPRRLIYILHTCPLDNDFLLKSPTYVRKLLLNHMNVHVVKYNRTEIFAGTPVKQLWDSKRIDDSKFPVEHSSDILRLTMLWRFGGMYCDLDVITIRPVDKLHSNYCGLESNVRTGTAILNFEPFGYGHYILTRALRRVNKHFNGAEWSANGPDLVTSMMLQVCDAVVAKDLPKCSSFKIYYQDILYPLHWIDHEKIFDTQLGNETVKSLKRTGFTVHLWNKFTYKFTVQVGSSQGYSILAEEFCPDVFNNCGAIM